MTQTMDEFIDGLRRDIARWKADLARLDANAQGKSLQTAEIRAWIDMGEGVIAQHESRYA
jgi:hypothetical protein